MCSCERHQEVTNRLDDRKKRISQLEVINAKIGEKIENLIQNIRDSV